MGHQLETQQGNTLPPPAVAPAIPLVIQTGADGVLDHTKPEEVTQIVKQVVAAGRAVLHVHGGLVNAQHGLATAARLDLVYRKAALTPVFPVWETGALETIRNHAGEIFREHLFGVLLKFVLKHAGGKLEQSPAGRAADTYVPLTDRKVDGAVQEAQAASRDPTLPEPLLQPPHIPVPPPTEVTPAESDYFRSDLEQSQELQDAVDGVMLGLGSAPPPGGRAPSPGVLPTRTLLSFGIQEELRREVKPGARGLFDVATIVHHGLQILVRVIKRFVEHRDHGLWPTAVEELCRELYLDAAGGVVWDLMKRDATSTFEPGTAQAPRGGSAFLDALGNELRAAAAAGKSLPKLSLVAHSAGSIWASHFLLALEARRARAALPADFRLHRLIVLAPACTDALFKAVLQQQGRRPLFDDFRLFALGDPLESGYWEAPPLYPRSLLYMVSGMFEEDVDMPLLGMQRYYTGDSVYHTPETDEVRSYLSTPATHAVWSVAKGAPGLSSDSTRHGAFTDSGPPLPSTMNSVLYFLGDNPQ